MLKIQALDRQATLKFSEYTKKWYVCASIEISDGSILRGGSEHRYTPDEAVEAYWDYLISHDPTDKVVVNASNYRGSRREYQWNGAAFAECFREQ